MSMESLAQDHSFFYNKNEDDNGFYNDKELYNFYDNDDNNFTIIKKKLLNNNYNENNNTYNNNNNNNNNNNEYKIIDNNDFVKKNTYIYNDSINKKIKDIINKDDNGDIIYDDNKNEIKNENNIIIKEKITQTTTTTTTRTIKNKAPIIFFNNKTLEETKNIVIQKVKHLSENFNDGNNNNNNIIPRNFYNTKAKSFSFNNLYGITYRQKNGNKSYCLIFEETINGIYIKFSTNCRNTIFIFDARNKYKKNSKIDDDDDNKDNEDDEEKEEDIFDVNIKSKLFDLISLRHHENPHIEIYTSKFILKNKYLFILISQMTKGIFFKNIDINKNFKESIFKNDNLNHYNYDYFLENNNYFNYLSDICFRESSISIYDSRDDVQYILLFIKYTLSKINKIKSIYLRFSSNNYRIILEALLNLILKNNKININEVNMCGPIENGTEYYDLVKEIVKFKSFKNFNVYSWGQKMKRLIHYLYRLN